MVQPWFEMQETYKDVVMELSFDANDLNRDFGTILFDEDTIKARVKELGAQITREYSAYVNEGIVVVGVLRGAVVFMADLLREIKLPVQIDFLTVSSYGDRAASSGKAALTQHLSTSVEGRHVLVVEDILDTGLTLETIAHELLTAKALSVDVAVLLDKQKERKYMNAPRYVAFKCPDKYVVGYGLDYAQRYRNVPFVASLKPEVYE